MEPLSVTEAMQVLGLAPPWTLPQVVQQYDRLKSLRGAGDSCNDLNDALSALQSAYWGQLDAPRQAAREEKQVLREKERTKWAEAGGPTAWTHDEVSTWSMLGLTPQAAKEWQQSGWSVSSAGTFAEALQELNADGVAVSMTSGLPRPTKHPARYWHGAGVDNLVWAIAFEDHELEPQFVADIGPWETMAGLRRGATSEEMLRFHETQCSAEVIDICARRGVTPSDMEQWDPAELESLIEFLGPRGWLGNLPTLIDCDGYEAAVREMGEDPYGISTALATHSPNLFAHSRPHRAGDEDAHAALYRAAIESGASERLAQMAADLGIHPSMVKGGLRQAEGFISAGSFHDFDYAAGLLEDAEGDSDRAWQVWADNFDKD